MIATKVAKSVVKPKAKLLLWPITADINSAMNQSELKANACNRRQARENACERGTKVARVLATNHRAL